MKISLRVLAMLVLALSTATISAAAQIASQAAPASRSTVTARELEASTRTDLFDFVRAHRPLWLNTRGPTSAGSPGVLVYVDGMRRGGLEELHAIPTAIVVRLTYLSASEASLRWGTGHSDGVILVTTGNAGSTPTGVAAAGSVGA